MGKLLSVFVLLLALAGNAQAQQVVYEFNCSGHMTVNCTVEKHTYLGQDPKDVAVLIQSQRTAANHRFEERVTRMRAEGEAECEQKPGGLLMSPQAQQICLMELANLRTYDQMTGEHPILKNTSQMKFVKVYWFDRGIPVVASTDVLGDDQTSLQHCIGAPNEDEFRQCVGRVDGARQAEIDRATKPVVAKKAKKKR